MAYPYLPVNPCCTDVVLNTPCGCSSTITNSGCNSNDPCNTHLTASSTIVYDGPALTCTTAEPCDTLNVILQKIDEIICNLLGQINTLNNQINNITTQVLYINSEITNIYNVLDVCCNVTTTTTSSSSSTTTTTTLPPCESFSLTNTGIDPVAIIITDCDTQVQEAIVLLPGDTNICVVTDSPLNVPGTVIVIPNGPCDTTTTTTTALPACNCITFSNTDVDSQTFSYNDCSGTPVENQDIASHEVVQVCGSNPTVGDPFVQFSVGAACISEVCPPPSTSTTTSTTTAIPCECLTFTNTDESAIDHDISYTDCFGDFIETTISAGQVINVCGCCGLASSELVIISIGANCIGGLCPGETTTTTTTTICQDCIAYGFPNPNDGNGTGTINGITVTTTYTGPSINAPGIRTDYNNCAGFPMDADTLYIAQLTGAFTLTISFSSPVNDVYISNSAMGYNLFPGQQECFTVNSDQGTPTLSLVGGCYDYGPVGDQICGSWQGGNTGGSVQVSTSTPYTELTITGVGISNLVGYGFDICFPSCNTTTTTSSSTSTSTSTTTTSSSSTTTTTTTITCTIFSLTGLDGGGSWQGIDCSTGEPLTGTIGGGDTENTPCIITTSLSIDNLENKDAPVPCVPSTTTSTSSTTTTTTTAYCSDCVAHNDVIGTQTWAGCNLNVSTYANGDTIPEVSDPTAWAALTTGAWCYPNGNPLNEAFMGRLYNWYAINDPRGLAPAGYHIPTDTEWTTLTTYLGGESVAGGELKQIGDCSWTDPNTDAVDSVGFTALPAGLCDDTGAFLNIGNNGYWWTATAFDSTDSWLRSMSYANGSVVRTSNSKNYGLSVRVIQD